MADETNRDEQLRGNFNSLRDRAIGLVRSQRESAPAEAEQPQSPQQAETKPEPPVFEELTQERMEAMKLRFYGEKARLVSEGYEKQQVTDMELRRVRWAQEIRKAKYEVQKAEASTENRLDAFVGLAKPIPGNKIDNRPGEKLMLKRTRGMARKRPLSDDPGPSP